MTIAGARADFVTLDNGQVITVPEWAEPCRYEKTYCPKGWLPDGTFPHERVVEFFKQAIAKKVQDAKDTGQSKYPICGGEIREGCYEFLPICDGFSPTPDHCR